MKNKTSPFEWKAYHHIFGSDKISEFNVLRFEEDEIKKLKKKVQNKEEFSEELRRHLAWRYWSRCEWELIIEITEENKVVLKPWIGREDISLDVTEKEGFPWFEFAKQHIENQRYGHKAKIDVYDQIRYRWSEFCDYCWNYRHKYERVKKDADNK